MTTQSFTQTVRRPHGFTLVELVVVVLILGIIAAVASPSMFDAAGDARDNAAHTSLSVVRDAIQLYRAQNGTLPGDAGSEADFKADLDSLINGPFPILEVGNAGDTVKIETNGNPLSVTGSESWKYNNQTGEFIINDAGYANL